MIAVYDISGSLISRVSSAFCDVKEYVPEYFGFFCTLLRVPATVGNETSAKRDPNTNHRQKFFLNHEEFIQRRFVAKNSVGMRLGFFRKQMTQVLTTDGGAVDDFAVLIGF